MSKTTFDIITRTAIWSAYKNICFYCSQPLDWGDLHIDHIIPESFLKKEKEFEKIKQEIEIDADFNLNELYNLVPSHSKCNHRKNESVFSKSTTLFYLSITYKKVTQINLEIEKLKRNKNKGLILSKLQSALSTNTIDAKDLKKILIEIEKNNWNIKEIKLPIGVEFIDEIYDTFYLNTDFSKLFDNKLLIHNDEESLELVNDENKKINVSTLNEWKKATKEGYYPLTTYAIKSSSTFTFFEEFIEALEKAKMPKVSFINDPWIEIDMLDYLSPNILLDIEGELTVHIENGLSIGDLVKQGIVKINSPYIYKICLEFGGFETSLIEQFRADFNDDGIEDIFVRGWTRAIEGTMGFGFTTILKKLSEKHLIEKE
ncbi:HNH endonuclease [Flavobacterium sp. TSSA_36]|uniref:HNH endonuclease n=1 Tax=Flavobacterium sp. TSSA_36 TaxID=3447669 RepID=UPI003F33EEFB